MHRARPGTQIVHGNVCIGKSLWKVLKSDIVFVIQVLLGLFGYRFCLLGGAPERDLEEEEKRFTLQNGLVIKKSKILKQFKDNLMHTHVKLQSSTIFSGIQHRSNEVYIPGPERSMVMLASLHSCDLPAKEGQRASPFVLPFCPLGHSKDS